MARTGRQLGDYCGLKASLSCINEFSVRLSYIARPCLKKLKKKNKPKIATMGTG